ncbi:MAG: response regulator [Deltaproteobacteria bacterium]|nr:response regulator [Deltaproteobacteria bacterium]
MDDELVLRKLGEATLKQMGYNVLLAGDGREGLAKFEEDIERAIDLVILDLTMPHLSGREVLQKVKTLAPGPRSSRRPDFPTPISRRNSPPSAPTPSFPSRSTRPTSPAWSAKSSIRSTRIKKASI